jgi:hypothetical protein
MTTQGHDFPSLHAQSSRTASSWNSNSNKIKRFYLSTRFLAVEPSLHACDPIQYMYRTQSSSRISWQIGGDSISYVSVCTLRNRRVTEFGGARLESTASREEPTPRPWGEARTPIAHRTRLSVPIQAAPSARLPPRASPGDRKDAPGDQKNFLTSSCGRQGNAVSADARKGAPWAPVPVTAGNIDFDRG